MQGKENSLVKEEESKFIINNSMLFNRDMFLDRIQTQEEIYAFIENVFGERKKISLEEF